MRNYIFPLIIVWLGLTIIVTPLLSKDSSPFPGDLGECVRPSIEYQRLGADSWNPYLLMGRPGIVDGTLYPLIYPTYALYSFFPGASFFPWVFLAHLCWAGTGMFLLLTCWGRSRLAAAAGALLFAGSGFMTARIFAGQLPHISSAAWTPWVFWAGQLFINRLQISRAILLGAVFGCQLLAGFPQFALITAIGVIFFAACRKRTWHHQTSTLLLHLLLSAAVFWILTFSYILPLATFLQNSHRAAEFALGKVLTNSLHPRDFIHFWFPLYDQDPLAQETIPRLIQFWETSIFIGVLPWALIGFGFYYGSWKKTQPRILLLLMTAAFFLALGENFFIYPFLLKWLPGFSSMRVPSRFLLLWVIGLPALAAFAIDRLQTRFPLLRRRWSWLLILVFTWELLSLSWYLLVPPFPVYTGMPYWSNPNPVTSFLQAQPKPFRLLPLADAAFLNESLYYRLENCGGFTGLVPRRLIDLVRIFDPGNLRDTPLFFFKPFRNDFALLKLLDVGYIITHGHLLDVTSGNTEPVYRDGDLKVFATPFPHHRAWLVSHYRDYDSEEQVLNALASPLFDPYREAVGISDGAVSTIPVSTEMSHGVVNVTQWSAGRLVLQVTATQPEVLVISELFYPGWEAEIDGIATEVFPVDHALIGISMASGVHTVTLEYKDIWQERQQWILAISTLIAILLAITAAKRKHS